MAGSGEERVAELRNKLAVVVVNAGLLVEMLGDDEAGTRAAQALRGAWAAAAVADQINRELQGAARPVPRTPTCRRRRRRSRSSWSSPQP